jgi:release factor glutamine methyltransferase
MTYQDITEQVHTLLAAAGIENAAVEAENLVIEMLGISRNEYSLGKIMQKKLDVQQQTLIRKAAEKRAEHYPLQYITSKAYFRNLVLEVNCNVLIPRFETEILVDEVLKNIPRSGTLLDVGTGSGTIAVSCAVERPDISVTAVDVSEKALETAQRNAEKYNAENIVFLQSDLACEIPETQKFDVVAANLPYVKLEEYASLQEEVRRYEPQLALTAENDGLELIYRLCDDLDRLLNPDGYAVFEMSPPQTGTVKEYLENLGFSSEIINDYTGRSRFVTARKR